MRKNTTLSQKLAGSLLKMAGWSSKGYLPERRRFIVISAPHTSMWDFVIGRLFYFEHNLRAMVMIKKELFFFPLGWFLKKIGAFPVDRNKRDSSTVDQIVEAFAREKDLILTITPEGTRKKVKHWKKGFYTISMRAGVPILPSYFDYRTKTVGIGELFTPSGNYPEDMKQLLPFFKGVTAKHPENFHLPDF